MSGSSRGQSVAASSKAKDRKWRSCVIHIAPADCTESPDRDKQLSGDVDDRLSTTRAGMHVSARYDGAVRRRHLPTSVHSLDTLSHRQSVEVVTHGVCDVVVLALSDDESRCSIQQ